MKYLALALIACTFIFCACHYAMPFLNEQRTLALEEAKQRAEERNITLQLILIQPGHTTTGYTLGGKHQEAAEEAP